MRIGLISYPMLFQRLGGLQVQVLETMRALAELGHDARYIDAFEGKLSDFDVIHVFGAINGNHRIVEAACDQNLPVVISTVLHPPFTAFDRRLCELADSLLGRFVGWEVTTSYRQIRAALDGASRIVALGDDERDMLIEGYGQGSGKIEVIPNGVAQRFYGASPDLFRDRFAPGGRVIACIASVNERKNQLAAARAVSELDAELFLFGPCDASAEAYLEQVKEAAPGAVNYCGSLNYDDPMLPSAYAAADIMLLPSLSEVMPISVLEALAAGAPVVMTKNHSLGIAAVPGILEMVDPTDVAAIREACQSVLADPPERERVRELVKDFTWRAVAEKLLGVYEAVLAP